VIAEPPFSAPAYQVKPTVVADVTVATFAKLTGASGLVIIFAPLP